MSVVIPPSVRGKQQQMHCKAPSNKIPTLSPARKATDYYTPDPVDLEIIALSPLLPHTWCYYMQIITPIICGAFHPICGISLSQ